MKKRILSFVLVISILASLVTAFPVTVNAATKYTEGIYTYTVEGGGATITDCASNANGDVVIPSTLGGYLVTSIGNLAFCGCDGLTSITISDSITSIGDSAFASCRNLSSVVIPDSVTSIGEYAFKCCHSLTSITIPNGVTSIKDGMFYWCWSLESVTIPNSVTNIGNSAFNCCTRLTNIVIPNNVTSIGNNTFESCEYLTNITIPNSVTRIGDFAFKYCRNLTSITIPGSVTSMGDSVFLDCSSLTSVTILDGVTNIYDSAFESCDNLASVIIPESVTNIGISAFQNCEGLENITIPNGVINIGKYAFQGCSDLTSIEIPATIESIDDSVFYGCSSLTDVYYAGSEEDWNKISFGSSNGNLLNATIHYNCGSESENGTNYIIEVGDVSARPGTIIVVPVNISSNPGMLGLALNFDYDSSVFTYKGAVQGTALDSLSFTKPTNYTEGNITFVWDGWYNDSANGEILRLGFAVADGADYGAYSISITVKSACKNDAYGELEDVETYALDGTVYVTENGSGNMLGDVDGDGNINSRDVVYMRRYIAGGYGVVVNEFSADVNFNGEVDLRDVVSIRRNLVGGYEL